MIVIYAEKQDMGLKFAAALGGIQYGNILVNTDTLPQYQEKIKKELANKDGYLKTKYNGTEYIVTWGWGHFGTLKDIKDYNPEYDKWYKIPLPYFPKKFEIKQRLNNNPNKDARAFFRKRDANQLKIVTKLFNDSRTDYIINATDWEREGELIFAYVYELTGTKKPYKRLRNNAKTEDQIREDFRHLVDATENTPYVFAARARSIADWIIGINMTIAGTLHLSTDRSLLNIGRVFTPTLALITDRENEIQNFKQKTVYGVEGTFTPASGDHYTGKLIAGDNSVPTALFETKEEALDLCKKLHERSVITSVKETVEKKKPPLLYNTSTLQQEANEVYGFTIQHTLDVAQKLYEGGYITYPRVDSEYLTEDKESEMPSLIQSILGRKRYQEFAPNTLSNFPKRYFDDSKVEGHDAIICTTSKPTSLSEDEDKIYDLILRRMIMAVSKPQEIKKTTILTDNATPEHLFKTVESVCIEPGFTKVGVKYSPKDTESSLPKDIKERVKVLSEFHPYEQTNTKPKRYTESTLIKAMENCGKKMEDKTAKEYLKRSKGIGRPSTRAGIIERLIAVGFVKRSKNALVPTEKGMCAIDVIPIDDLKSPMLTAKWEQDLDEIERTKTVKEATGKLNAFVREVEESTTNWCAEFRQKDKRVAKATGEVVSGAFCPICGGKMLRSDDAYYCENYNDGCKVSVKRNFAGKYITAEYLIQLCSNGVTEEIQGFKSKKGKTFSGMLKLNDAYACATCGAIQSKSEECYKCGSKKFRRVSDRKVLGFEFPERSNS